MDSVNVAVALPVEERSDEQALMLKHMCQMNQRLLGPYEDADGKVHPRLTMAEAVATLYEWSTEHRDRAELARDFAVIAAQLARCLPSADAREGE